MGWRRVNPHRFASTTGKTTSDVKNGYFDDCKRGAPTRGVPDIPIIYRYDILIGSISWVISHHTSFDAIVMDHIFMVHGGGGGTITETTPSQVGYDHESR